MVTNPELSGCATPYTPISGSTWNMNGCEYVFNMGEDESDVGTVDINNCNSPISWRTSGVGGDCEVQIPMQSGIKAVGYESSGSTQEGNLKLQINAELSGIKYTQKGSLCHFPGTHENGTYTGTWAADDGFRFRSPTSYPALGGQALQTQRFVFGGPEQNPEMTCQKVAYSGTLSGKAAPSVTIVPGYSECKMKVIGFSITPTVKMGGCAYQLRAHGALSIAGGTCASNPITIRAANFLGECKITIGPQSLGTVGLANVEGAVKVSPNISTLAHTATGLLCINEGAFANGTFSGDSRITASGGLSIS